MNRHDRRRADRLQPHLKSLRFKLAERRNGISHAEVSYPAWVKLVDMMEGQFGNTLSDSHKTALAALVASFTDMAQGSLQGRYAFGYPTGLGKTTAIVAWLSALIAAGVDDVSVAVSASKVEALCDLKRRLIDEGNVPPDMIGLVHSYDYDPTKVIDGISAEGYATEPSTESDRPIMLVTHQRVRGCSLDSFNLYRDKPRDLLIYDESLIVSDSLGIPVNELKGAVGWLTGKWGDTEKYREVISYTTACRDMVLSELEKLRGTESEGTIRFPALAPEKLTEFQSLLGRSVVTSPLRLLLDIADQTIRVIENGSGGVVWYHVSVPPEIENVIVLDASQPIRKLVHLDPSIKDAEKHVGFVRNIGVPLAHLKRFDRVALFQMFSGGGRTTLTEDFASERAEDRKIAREVVEVVKTIRPEEAVLIFTYKSRPTDKVAFREILLADLTAAGVDVASSFAFRGKQRRRINVVTWGMETSLNDFNHCSRVILAGVMQRSPIDLAASYLGQTDNLSGPVSQEAIRELHRSEVCHSIYQALSRGTCRTAVNGMALPMTGYIIHRDDGIQPELSKVMPGVVWKTWERQHQELSAGAIKTLAHQIKAHLEANPPTAGRISTGVLKKALGVNVPARTWTHAVRHLTALDGGWTLDGRSLARSAAMHGFTVAPSPMDHDETSINGTLDPA